MNNTERPTLKCRNGVFVGYEKDGVHIFKGIPYAKPPVGDLRWRPPQRPDDSDKVFDASEFLPSKLHTAMPWLEARHICIVLTKRQNVSNGWAQPTPMRCHMHSTT